MVTCYLHKSKDIFLIRYLEKLTIKDIDDVYATFYKHKTESKKMISIIYVGKNTSLWDLDALKIAGEKDKEARKYISKTFITELYGIQKIFYRMYLGFLSTNLRQTIEHLDSISKVEEELNIKFPDEFDLINK